MAEDPLVLSANRTLFTYATLLTAAETAANLAKSNQEKQSELSLMAILHATFALEAYLNDLGDHLLGCWDELERGLSPEAKLKLVLERLGRNEERGKGPFQSFVRMFRIRNQLVHGKTISLNYEYTSPGGAVVAGRSQADWEATCNSEAATAIVGDARQMIETLHTAAGRSESWWVHAKTTVQVPGETQERNPTTGEWRTTSIRAERRLSDFRRERAADHYTYEVRWSQDDGRYVGTCADLPLLTYSDTDRNRALRGIADLATSTVLELIREGKAVPNGG